ncbi:MAG: hypothetical protein AVDCRST_MAG67-4016 [uncultured Solirubrobacteraceae bacterium]|uniref:Uncharacterized protein n=1 Tax=uncultured Solirubrobacteraceae bacterium TaxID=1162706 RepID=A0A6J4TQR8_9ACTN|nr:MAG: hypothetical protein AVDCRST_MAG67-4016 [uncultured Solirubrobacteraceae bacterium]
MSKTTLTVITVTEIVALVAVLGAYLVVVAAGLRSIVSTLAEVTWGARAVERQLLAVPANLRAVNVGLTDAATVLPSLSDTVGRKVGRPV